jgi:hypothetical protein
MKKFGITTFAVLYALMVIAVTVERSSDWAVREADTLAQPCCGPPSSDSGRMEAVEVHLSQKKRVETEFAIELPREAVLLSNHSGRYTPVPSFEYQFSQSDRPSLSRSPPSSPDTRLARV